MLLGQQVAFLAFHRGAGLCCALTQLPYGVPQKQFGQLQARILVDLGMILNAKPYTLKRKGHTIIHTPCGYGALLPSDYGNPNLHLQTSQLQQRGFRVQGTEVLISSAFTCMQAAAFPGLEELFQHPKP